MGNIVVVCFQYYPHHFVSMVLCGPLSKHICIFCLALQVFLTKFSYIMDICQIFSKHPAIAYEYGFHLHYIFGLYTSSPCAVCKFYSKNSLFQLKMMSKNSNLSNYTSYKLFLLNWILFFASFFPLFVIILKSFPSATLKIFTII